MAIPNRSSKRALAIAGEKANHLDNVSMRDSRKKVVTPSAAPPVKKTSSPKVLAGAGRAKLAVRRRGRGRLPEKDIRQQRGVIYLGHIPHGFFETEMRQFFTQFGTVARVRLCRSNKSERSKGYAFIEFREPDVAQIAAETMDGYMMFDKRLQCHVVPAEHVHRDTFRARILGVTKKPKSVPRKIKPSVSDGPLAEKRQPADEGDKPPAKKDRITILKSKMQGKLNKLSKLGIVAPLELNDADRETPSETKPSATPTKVAAVAEKSPVKSADADKVAAETPCEVPKRGGRRKTAVPAATTASPANKTPPIAKRTRSAKRLLQ